MLRCAYRFNPWCFNDEVVKMLYMCGYSIKEAVNHEFWPPHILETRGKGAVIMKFEKRNYNGAEYLLIRNNDGTKMPHMINLSLASKEDIIGFLEWLEKKAK